MAVGILNLTPEQRAQLFHGTGMPLRRIAVNTENSQGGPVDRCCSRCLLADDLPGVVIGPNGLCNHCSDYAAELSSGMYSSRQLLETVQAYRTNGTPDSVLAFSGGKDSALALLLAVKELNLKPLAILVDNGFIPEEVQVNGRKFCEGLGVQLVVEKIDIRHVARSSLQSTSGEIPCTSCIGGIFAKMARACRDHQLRLIIGGHRFPPLTYPVSAFTKRAEDQQFACVSPLLARRLPEAQQLELIEAAGWKKVSIAGNTSNCKLIGVVEEHLYDVHGYNPHLFEVSKEIRAGFYGREDGYGKVDRPRITAEHRDWVQQRLGQPPVEQSVAPGNAVAAQVSE
jgi:predicted PP-loop superfamily ATPase